MTDNDTICAVSTPVGVGGIGVIRMSGPRAREILKNLFVPKGQKRVRFVPRRLYLGHIANPLTKSLVDEVLAVFMAAPATYTREDVAEVHSHGGIATVRAILSLMIGQGARLAEPGEFTRRAFLNGRIDLIQAEAVIDIIGSETEEELFCALDHLRGRPSWKLGRINEALRNALAEVEALIDFPEEEIDVDLQNGAVRGLLSAGEMLGELVASYDEGRAFTEGFEVLIVGRTNVGKSSLLNALLEKERAIVTAIPGTTRDLVEDTLHIRGIKVRLTDTAGIRKPEDIVEEAGINRVKERIPGADLLLWVMDGSEHYGAEDEEICGIIGEKTCIIVINKTDLPRVLVISDGPPKQLRQMEVSALNDEGVDLLREALYEAFMGKGPRKGGVLITSVRQADALVRTKTSVERAVTCIANEEPLEFAAFELREALSFLGEVTGETCSEAILHDIFNRFCIGK